MASIEQTLFTWQAVESSPEIKRFHRLLEGIDDEALMRHLEADRKGRRDDNPVRAMWNSLLAGFWKSSLPTAARSSSTDMALPAKSGWRRAPAVSTSAGMASYGAILAMVPS